ncbi:MAG: hypothetical protein WKG01_05095 [Kofleriaceae bacterium]
MTVACLDLPAFPLQLVWRDEPSWRAHPVVVIDEDRPQGMILWACERARRVGVLVGQRYAHALSLCGGLRARIVPPERIEAATSELRAALHRLSPRVEPGEPGTFWLDGDGLARIFLDDGKPDGTAWGTAIASTATEYGMRGAVVVGFSRFATYAIARATRHGVTVLRGDADERAAASAVPLARLDVEPKLRDALARLGVSVSVRWCGCPVAASSSDSVAMRTGCISSRRASAGIRSCRSRHPRLPTSASCWTTKRTMSSASCSC